MTYSRYKLLKVLQATGIVPSSRLLDKSLHTTTTCQLVGIRSIGAAVGS